MREGAGSGGKLGGACVWACMLLCCVCVLYTNVCAVRINPNHASSATENSVLRLLGKALLSTHISCRRLLLFDVVWCVILLCTLVVC